LEKNKYPSQPRQQSGGRRQAPDDPTDATVFPPPTPLEVVEVRKRLGRNLIAEIKRSAVHGLRKIPKSSITERQMARSTITAVMRGHDGDRTSDTGRMTRWNLTNDRDISRLLEVERLVHPVRHDGTGHILLPGSSAVYNWARFVGVEVRYDKREMLLTVVAKTVGAGSGSPENAVEKVRYSRGETED